MAAGGQREVTIDPPARRRVTISEIAREAGVSLPTVSRVVNRRGDVAPHTRERIEELLRRHGYRARSAAGRQARLLDLVFNDLDSPWAVEIIRGVEDVTHAAGVGTVVSAIHRRTASARKWLDNLQARASDGVILVTSQLTTAMQLQLRRLDVPLVVVDPVGRPAPDVPTIGATNWAGGLSAAEHLTALGHRRIGFIGGPPEMQCSRARFDGYRAALETAGIPFDDTLVCPGDFYHSSGYAGALALLDLPEPPTAIFAASDQMALGAYEATRSRHVRIPDDVSIVGFDDLPTARWASPPLTTVRQPLAEMGTIAARTVLGLASGEAVMGALELATELVVRASTAPPSDGPARAGTTSRRPRKVPAQSGGKARATASS
jgi:LacI family transcriptional regulator